MWQPSTFLLLNKVRQHQKSRLRLYSNGMDLSDVTSVEGNINYYSVWSNYI
jgi:hypothetical protein